MLVFEGATGCEVADPVVVLPVHFHVPGRRDAVSELFQRVRHDTSRLLIVGSAPFGPVRLEPQHHYLRKVYPTMVTFRRASSDAFLQDGIAPVNLTIDQALPDMDVDALYANLSQNVHHLNLVGRTGADVAKVSKLIKRELGRCVISVKIAKPMPASTAAPAWPIDVAGLLEAAVEVPEGSLLRRLEVQTTLPDFGENPDVVEALAAVNRVPRIARLVDADLGDDDTAANEYRRGPHNDWLPPSLLQSVATRVGDPENPHFLLAVDHHTPVRVNKEVMLAASGLTAALVSDNEAEATSATSELPVKLPSHRGVTPLAIRWLVRFIATFHGGLAADDLPGGLISNDAPTEGWSHLYSEFLSAMYTDLASDAEVLSSNVGFGNALGLRLLGELLELAEFLEIRTLACFAMYGAVGLVIGRLSLIAVDEEQDVATHVR